VTDLPARIGLLDGRFYPGVLRDYSDNSVGIELAHGNVLPANEAVNVILRQGPCEFVFSGKIQRSVENTVGISLDPMGPDQARDYMRCTFARAHSWLDSSDKFPLDRPLHSIYGLIGLSIRGYGRMARHAPWPTQVIFRSVRSVAKWMLSFVPRTVTPSTTSFLQRPYET
jgi:cellulose synthase (UDP-forming)